ncbi:hypothetical protein TKV_c19650 [Thermoanaerobacter kivui]|uniref:Uncharacterized protein n=1 Tax=Thermoanaerobacter kivui TaxID=2325 RepID=A0A097ATI7_THEKI|nr:hypothetical protein TKV_c19650 [Thermoanaerobacter kivui]
MDKRYSKIDKIAAMTRITKRAIKYINLIVPERKDFWHR